MVNEWSSPVDEVDAFGHQDFYPGVTVGDEPAFDATIRLSG